MSEDNQDNKTTDDDDEDENSQLIEEKTDEKHETVAALNIETKIKAGNPNDNNCQKRFNSIFWIIFQILITILSALYLLFLAIIIIVPLDYSRSNVSKFDASSNNTEPIHEMVANDCSFNWSNIKSKLDVYLILHGIRWFWTAITMRNRIILYTNSILWEVIEFLLSLSFFSKLELEWLAECWFDKIFFDVLGMNLIGIELALFIIWILKKCKLAIFYREFNEIWISLVKCGNITKVIYIQYIMIICYQIEHSFVFIVYPLGLWVDAGRLLGMSRSVLIVCIGYCTTKQLYYWWIDKNNDNGHILGNFRKLWWSYILQSVLLLEFIFVIKIYVSE